MSCPARLARISAGSLLCAAIGLCITGAAAAREPTPDATSLADRTLPGDSLFQLSIVLETADRGALKLENLRGPLILTMFYATCASVCPLITSRLQTLVAALTPAEQAKLTILMVSFDSERDTPAVLREFKAQHRIDAANWIVARAPARDVRLLAAALGIRYRESADHSFNHSTMISLTDEQGTVRARTTDALSDEAQFTAAVHRLLAAAARPN